MEDGNRALAAAREMKPAAIVLDLMLPDMSGFEVVEQLRRTGPLKAPPLVVVSALDNYDARFVIVTQGPIDEALAYKRRVGNRMTWYSTANSSFGEDVGAPPGGGFAGNVFLRDGDRVYRTWHSDGRGTEQLSQRFISDVVLPDGSDAKGWYVSLSRAREAMHVYTRDKAALCQSVMYPGERKSVWELTQALGKLKPQS